MNRLSGILIAMAGCLLLCTLPVIAQKGQGDATGIAREIEKPPIEHITGELLRIETGPCEQTTGHAYIGTHLYLKSDENGQVLNIHLGAAYAVASYVKNLEIGKKLDVKGFRTELLKRDNYVAKEITVNGHTYQLRDENLRPFWAGERFQSSKDRFERPFRGRRGRW